MNRVPPTRRLSVGTLFYKRVFPTVFLAAGIVAMGIGAWKAIAGAGNIFEVLPFVAAMAVGYAIIRLMSSGTADEVLDGGDYLFVRKDGIDEHVPLADIETVTESLWNRQPPKLELVLRAPGKLGRVISFVPANFSTAPFSRSALYFELSDRVARAQRQADEAPSTRHQA